MALTVWWRLLFTPSKEPLSHNGYKAECSSFFFFFLQRTWQEQGEAACVSTAVLAVSENE